MPDDIKYMDLQEFREGGYLHEVNRLLLHPLGLALAVGTDGSMSVWDYRDDPEGMEFGEALLSAEKAEKVCTELLERRAERIRRLGWVIQPVPSSERTLTVNYREPEQQTIPQDGFEFEA